MDDVGGLDDGVGVQVILNAPTPRDHILGRDAIAHVGKVPAYLRLSDSSPGCAGERCGLLRRSHRRSYAVCRVVGAWSVRGRCVVESAVPSSGVRYVDQKKNTTGVRGLAAPGRVPPVQPCFVTENRAGRASRRSGRRQSGRRRSPPERCGGIRELRPFHRLLRCVARPSLSLSRGRPTAPYEGENLYPRDWAHGPLRGRDPVPGDCANPGAHVSGGWARTGTPRAPASLPSQGRTRGVLRRRESAIPPSVDRSSR